MPLGSPGSSSAVWSDLILRGRGVGGSRPQRRPWGRAAHCPPSASIGKSTQFIDRSIDSFGHGKVNCDHCSRTTTTTISTNVSGNSSVGGLVGGGSTGERQTDHRGLDDDGDDPSVCLSVGPTLQSGAHSLSESAATSSSQPPSPTRCAPSSATANRPAIHR